MKIRWLTVALLATSLAAFAQGKIRFGNSSDYPFVFNLTYMYSADLALQGQLVPASPLPSGVTLGAFLYAGTSSSTMTLQTSIPLTASTLASPGIMSGVNLNLDIPGGMSQFFQVVVADVTQPFNSFYYGWSNDGANNGIFTATPGTSIAYPSLLAGSSSASTWLPGTFIIHGAPEPSSFALLVLGALGCFLGRRARRDSGA